MKSTSMIVIFTVPTQHLKVHGLKHFQAALIIKVNIYNLGQLNEFQNFVIHGFCYETVG